ncbi:uncharacterized protein BDZ99DRAFT_507903 [Mytilinidion resinicola]|uniref:DUF7779 domain-containing protein n=1 Tax=Mytilinidion resinicola TaxID=574789 RepID=A0A6A6YTQ0_9PEZI|nr:uncharacterized protein BDZ99DRAFT_507903 [Mytilinidion resinicola]KAF2811394.1 hypothetical protein BDZ99DRAFT_507903 [Mytilinidion resinicola]
MDSSDLELFFNSHWKTTIEQCENSLEPDDLEQVRLITSWDSVQKDVLDSAGTDSSKVIPYEIALIKPTLGHFHQFTQVFESQLAPGIQADYFWGIIGVLLKLTAQDPQALSKIPRMLKSLGYKAEAFKVHYTAARESLDQIKEACFDIQIQLVEFFTSAVKYMRGEEEEMRYNRRDDRDDRYGQDDPWLLLQRRFIATNQELIETIARIENLVAARPSGLDQNSSSDIATLTQQFRCMILPTKKSSRFFNRVDTFVKIDQVLGRAGSNTSFRSIAFNAAKIAGSTTQFTRRELDSCPELVSIDSHGKAIITTRNHSLAYEPATSGLEITSWDAKTGSEFLLFLLKRNIGSDIQAEGDSATELSKKLSGHALGISHMAGLIHRRSWSIAEFMRIYLKNPKRAHQTELQAVWDFSFATLEKDSRTFLGIASFLVSENIPQLLFEIEEDNDLPEDLAFCVDEFSFSDATEPLLTLALIKRDRDARVFSCHRMVQTQFRYYLPLEERQKAFDNAVALVYHAFPKQSDETNKNQFYQQWTQCNRCLQHVLSLKDNFKEERRLVKNFKAGPLFCELLKDCQRYLYEINALTDLEDVCEVNLQAVKTLDNEEQATDIAASTLSHQASMYESTGKVQKAIELNTKGYNMRLQENPLKGGLLGGFEQNLAYNYNTANDHETALTWFEKSRDTWIAWNVKEGREADWPTVTKKNMARCLVHLGQYDKAQALLDISITEFKKEKALNWAMLAYTYFVLGILERRRNRPEAAEASFIEAQNLWFKGDQTRLHPFNAGCIYKTGVVCLDQGKVEAAVKHLRDSLEITKFHANVMPVEHARGLFKLSEALFQDSYDGEEAGELRDEAELYLLRRDPQAAQSGREEDYDQWVPIFWR